MENKLRISSKLAFAIILLLTFLSASSQETVGRSQEKSVLHRFKCKTSSTRHISLLGRNSKRHASRRYFMIESPTSPETGKYKSNEDCRWLLRSDTPLRLEIDELDIENSPTCSFDSLQIYEDFKSVQEPSGEYSEKPNITLCGNHTTPPIKTKPGLTMIRFRTDASTEGKGFMLRFKKEKEDANALIKKAQKKRDKAKLNNNKPVIHVTNDALNKQPPNQEAVCNYTAQVTEIGGIIHSFVDPKTNTYLPNQDCFILLKSTRRLKLSFKDVLELQQPGNDGICRSDGLVIYNASFTLADHPKNNSHIFCGITDCKTICNALYTDGDAMLRFVTDSTYEFKGFTLRYEFAESPYPLTEDKGDSIAGRRVIYWGAKDRDPVAGSVNSATMFSGFLSKLDVGLAYLLITFLSNSFSDFF